MSVRTYLRVHVLARVCMCMLLRQIIFDNSERYRPKWLNKLSKAKTDLFKWGNCDKGENNTTVPSRQKMFNYMGSDESFSNIINNNAVRILLRTHKCKFCLSTLKVINNSNIRYSGGNKRWLQRDRQAKAAWHNALRVAR